jgi:hypothetical protein
MPAKKYYFCLALIFNGSSELYMDSEQELNFDNILSNLTLPLHEENISIGKVSLYFNKGMLCSYYFYFPNFRDFFGRYFNTKLDISILMGLLPSLINIRNDLYVKFEVDQCKMGEIFDGDFRNPCPINSYSNMKNLEGLSGLYYCLRCNEQDNFYCYGGNQRSPKRNYWRLNSFSEAFLRCPGTKCLGDPYFEKNITNNDCDDCLFPGEENIKIYSYYENYTAIGVCQHGYKGILCTECDFGFGSTDNYRCAECSNSFVYIKNFII